jgi:hypothetical protein
MVVPPAASAGGVRRRRHRRRARARRHLDAGDAGGCEAADRAYDQLAGGLGENGKGG